MFGDLNDCYGKALQHEIAESNRLEQELIEAWNRYAEMIYEDNAVMDMEKVIKALEHCKDNQHVNDCNKCDYGGKTGMFCIRMIDDAIALLKQEAVEPKKEDDGKPEPWTVWWYVCGDCGQPIDKMDRFCRRCGKAVKWD